MINLQQIKSVYLLGIGGIGMSALARYFNEKGAEVSGYDKTATPLTGQLISEGISIVYSDSVALLPEHPDLVIYTPAIPKDHPAFAYYHQKGTEVRKRAEILGLITRNENTIAVAGTHGKTTTSTLITHIFMTAGMDLQAFLGGISKNYETNFIESQPRHLVNSSPYFIVEADEYDKSFLHLHPQVALITSADADHLDIYGGVEQMKNSFREFAWNVKNGGSLIIKAGLNLNPETKESTSLFSYDLSAPADYHAVNLTVLNGSYHFDLKTPSGIIPDISVGIPGRFNVENAIGAAAVAHQCEIPDDMLRKALLTYQGVRRRFDFQVKTDGFIYMDDYAHHPEELKACINAVKEIYPGKRITGVFQPHLYSRTRDLALEFARSLELLDEVVLLDIYPAREEPIPGIDSNLILNKMNTAGKRLCRKDELIDVLKKMKPEVLLTLGAGDIDQLVEPIKEAFDNKTE